MRAAFLLVVVFTVSCVRIPPIRENDDQANSKAQLAPLVVVGVADADRIIGPAYPSRKDPNYPMLMHRVRIRIENTLRGVVDERTIFAYYFGLGAGFEGPRPLGFGKAESRRIFWLRGDSGVYRMACDGWDGCTILVRSGGHPMYRPDPAQPIERAFVDILLTRGEGPIENIPFATEIGWGIPDTGVHPYAVEKLRHLALTETSDVKESACEQLWIHTQDDSGNPAGEAATQALRDASCNCAPDSGGRLHCHPAP